MSISGLLDKVSLEHDARLYEDLSLTFVAMEEHFDWLLGPPGLMTIDPEVLDAMAIPGNWGLVLRRI